MQNCLMRIQLHLIRATWNFVMFRVLRDFCERCRPSVQFSRPLRTQQMMRRNSLWPMHLPAPLALPRPSNSTFNIFCPKLEFGRNPIGDTSLPVPCGCRCDEMVHFPGEQSRYRAEYNILRHYPTCDRRNLPGRTYPHSSHFRYFVQNLSDSRFLYFDRKYVSVDLKP